MKVYFDINYLNKKINNFTENGKISNLKENFIIESNFMQEHKKCFPGKIMDEFFSKDKDFLTFEDFEVIYNYSISTLNSFYLEYKKTYSFKFFENLMRKNDLINLRLDEYKVVNYDI